ncbi:UDP-N-acetyl glucosamine 2-epimerase, partial [Klebsiella pneumoniae]|uniref:UDP-N-acetyl glucosamine 2-epimerase n=4 Tax=Pseudomonadota TaxID=1224 RepID=UPI0013CF7B9C
LADDLVYAVPSRPSIGTARWETLWMIARLPAEIRRTRPDVLFVSGSTYTIVAAAMMLRFGRRCPAIVVKISNDMARRDLPPVSRFLWRRWL